MHPSFPKSAAPGIAGRSWILAACAALLGAPAASAQAAPERPNVLVIVADDLSGFTIGHPHFGGHHPSVRTPNIDRLANEGVSFTRAVSNWPSCAPARHAMLTGKLPVATGYRFYGNVREQDGVNRYAVFLPENFRAAGYRTARYDKIFHIGRDIGRLWDVTEEPFGTNRDRVINQGIGELQQLGLASHVRRTEEVLTQDIYEMKETDASGVAITAERLTDGVSATRAMERLDAYAASGERFFMMVGFRRPHEPYIVAREYFGMYNWGPGDDNVTVPGTPEIVLPAYPVGPQPAYTGSQATEYRKLLEAYYAATTQTDHLVGRLLAKLEERGLDDDTIVVFLGDHGYGLGERDRRIGKGTDANSGFQTPLIIRVPGSPRAGERETRAVTLADIYPTLLDLCGLPLPETALDGTSLAPLLRGRVADWVENAVAFLDVNNADATDLRVKRYVWGEGFRYYEDSVGNPLGLYNLDADPFEADNLRGSPAHAAVQARLKARLDDLVARSIARLGPTILAHPRSQVVPRGGIATFLVRVESDTPVTHAWTRDGVAIPGEEGPALVVSPVSAASAGSYACTVRGPGGRSVTFPAALVVSDAEGALVDVEIDESAAGCVVDGLNGNFYRRVVGTSQGFGPSLYTTDYPDRGGFIPWSPGVPHGNYEVSLWNPNWSKNASSVVVQVHGAGGVVTPVTTNLTSGKGAWKPLGTFALAPDSSVRLVMGPVPSGQNVPADGMRFRRLTAPANAAPVARDEAAASVAPDGTLVLDVLANDTDADAGDVLQVGAFSGGARGAVTLEAGKLVYRPFRGVVSGEDLLTYQAYDGKAFSGPARVRVAIGMAVGMVPVEVDVPKDGGSVSWTGGLSAYPAGSSVEFTPVPRPGYRFYHWEGDVRSQAAPLVLTLVDPLRLEARFRPEPTLTSHEAWLEFHGITADSAVDGDGWDALAEYAFDLDPRSRDAAGGVSALVPSPEGGTSRFTFRRSLNAEDLRFEVWSSVDLVRWDRVPGEPVVDDYDPDGDQSAQVVSVEIPASTSTVFAQARVSR